jgi:thioredoxin-related protein
MASRSEMVANTAIILACTIFSIHYGTDYYNRTHPAPPASPYKAGDSIDDGGHLGLSQANMTMLLVTRSGCHYCSASMPFYRRMAEAAGSAGVRLVGATAEPISENQSYLASNRVPVREVVSIAETKIKASATPTLILVRRNGQVVNSWVGQLPEAREKEVLQALNGGVQ